MKWYTKEIHLRQKLNIRTIDDESLEYLRTKHRCKDKFICNTPNYDILSNLRYSDWFFYTQMDRRDEDLMSDMIAQIVYLGEDHFEADDDTSPEKGEFGLNTSLTLPRSGNLLMKQLSFRRAASGEEVE